MTDREFLNQLIGYIFYGVIESDKDMLEMSKYKTTKRSKRHRKVQGL